MLGGVVVATQFLFNYLPGGFFYRFRINYFVFNGPSIGYFEFKEKYPPPPSLSQPNVYMQPFSEIDHKYDLNKTNSSILTHIPF